VSAGRAAAWLREIADFDVDPALQVVGPPAFLNPEATRQRKVCLAHVQPVAPAAQQTQPGANHDAQPAQFDVTKLAPRLKGEHDNGQAVLSAPAKRNRDEKPQAGSAYGNSALVRAHSMTATFCSMDGRLCIGSVAASTAQHLIQTA
jgi:hypothetical protein